MAIRFPTQKLTTVLAFYVVKDWHEACDLSIALLQNGIGHTMSLHTEDRNIILEFTRKPASRILVNTGGSMGGTGGSTGLVPSLHPWLRHLGRQLDVGKCQPAESH